MEESKDFYIKAISDRSDKYGNLLIQCMDYFNKNNLCSLTLQEVKWFFDNIIKENNYDYNN